MRKLWLPGRLIGLAAMAYAGLHAAARAESTGPLVQAPPAGSTPQPSPTAPAPAPAGPSAAAAGPLSVTAIAAGLAADNIAFASGPVTYRIAHAEFRNSQMTAGELTRLLDAGSGAALQDRITGIAAGEVVIPEIVSEIASGAFRQITHYRDVRLTNVGGGRIGAAAAAGGTFESSAPPGTSTGGFGRLDLADFDVGLTARLLTERSAAPDGAMKPIYGTAAIEDLTLTDPGGFAVRIGRVSARDVVGRSIPEGWLGALDAMGETPDLKAASPDARRRSASAVADLLGAYAVGSAEATGIALIGKGGRTSRVARIAYAGGPDRPADVKLEGIDIDADAARVKIAAAGLDGLSLKPTLDALRDFSDRQAGDLTPAEMRRFAPLVGRLAVSGVEVAPVGDPAGHGGAPPSISVGAVSVAAGKPVAGLPSDLSLSIDDVAFPIPAHPQSDVLNQIADLGYDKVDLSFKTAFGWNEPGQELLLRDLSAEGRDMGRFALHGVLGNVSKDIFNPDKTLASVALVGATIKSLNLGVDDGGLLGRVLAREARRQTRSTDDVRREYAMAAAVGIPAMLGGSEGARTLAQALARFIAKPGHLTVDARAKQPGGLGVADLAAHSSPAAILDKFEISASSD